MSGFFTCGIEFPFVIYMALFDNNAQPISSERKGLLKAE
jgi:hypothetical protein